MAVLLRNTKPRQRALQGGYLKERGWCMRAFRKFDDIIRILENWLTLFDQKNSLFFNDTGSEILDQPHVVAFLVGTHYHSPNIPGKRVTIWSFTQSGHTQ
jgi:hypothetical protein